MTDEQKGYLPVLPIQFIPIDDLTTFRGEMAIVDGDLVFHFFLTPEIQARSKPTPQAYWLEMFPAVLSKQAESYFQMTYPRLKAAYTEEQASWWMRAAGSGQVLDPHKFAYAFLDALDAALDDAITKAQ